MNVKIGKVVTESSLDDFLNEMLTDSGDENAAFKLRKTTKDDLVFFEKFSTALTPTHIVEFRYTDINGTTTEAPPYYLEVKQASITKRD